MNRQLIPRVARSAFGVMPDGTEVECITLRDVDGLEARIMTYGASLQALLVPDATGRRDDVVLGHDVFDRYVARRQYFGATIGRYANRIADGSFSLDGAMVIIAGSRKSFTNARFAQPGRYSREHEDHFYPGDQFPFAYTTFVV